jgi:hypothetical protein
MISPFIKIDDPIEVISNETLYSLLLLDTSNIEDSH